MEFSADELYFTSGGGGRSGSSWHQDDKATAQIVADDEAKLDHISFDMTTDRAIKGGTKAPGSGQSDLESSTIGTNTTGSTFTGDGAFTMGDGTYKGTGTTMAAIAQELKGSNDVVGLAVFVTGQAAERFWRDGKCVEVVANPNGGDVGAGLDDQGDRHRPTRVREQGPRQARRGHHDRREVHRAERQPGAIAGRLHVHRRLPAG